MQSSIKRFFGSVGMALAVMCSAFAGTAFGSEYIVTSVRHVVDAAPTMAKLQAELTYNVLASEGLVAKVDNGLSRDSHGLRQLSALDSGVGCSSTAIALG